MVQLNRSMMERYEIADRRPQTLRAVIFGADRLMFGSDFPMWDAETEAQRLLSLGLSDGENEGILHGNFERFEQMIAARL